MNRRCLSVLVLALCASGCASIAPCPPTGLAALRCNADRGDARAQLALGNAYQYGDGVAADPRRAARLYAAAAATTSGTIFVYSPGVGQVRGQVIPVRGEPARAGLPEAMRCLGKMLIEGRGIEQDIVRGKRLIAEADAVGGEPARDDQKCR